MTMVQNRYHFIEPKAKSSVDQKKGIHLTYYAWFGDYRPMTGAWRPKNESISSTSSRGGYPRNKNIACLSL